MSHCQGRIMWAHSLQEHPRKLLHHQKLSVLPLWIKSGCCYQGRRVWLLCQSKTLSAIPGQNICTAYLGWILHDMTPKMELAPIKWLLLRDFCEEIISFTCDVNRILLCRSFQWTLRQFKDNFKAPVKRTKKNKRSLLCALSVTQSTWRTGQPVLSGVQHSAFLRSWAPAAS